MRWPGRCAFGTCRWACWSSYFRCRGFTFGYLGKLGGPKTMVLAATENVSLTICGIALRYSTPETDTNLAFSRLFGLCQPLSFALRYML
jgi:hypothetical protein